MPPPRQPKTLLDLCVAHVAANCGAAVAAATNAGWDHCPQVVDYLQPLPPPALTLLAPRLARAAVLWSGSAAPDEDDGPTLTRRCRALAAAVHAVATARPLEELELDVTIGKESSLYVEHNCPQFDFI